MGVSQALKTKLAEVCLPTITQILHCKNLGKERKTMTINTSLMLGAANYTETQLLYIPAILTPYSGEIDPLRFLFFLIKERL
jgi:hypothetical protein